MSDKPNTFKKTLTLITDILNGGKTMACKKIKVLIPVMGDGINKSKMVRQGLEVLKK
jgi:hypothetical protein